MKQIEHDTPTKKTFAKFMWVYSKKKKGKKLVDITDLSNDGQKNKSNGQLCDIYQF